MINKVHIKMGPIEFEAEGDSELIERERSQFFKLLPQTIMAVSPVVHNSLITNNNTTNTEIDVLPVEAETSENSLKLHQSIVSFLNDKNFSNDVELIMGIAYYIECIENKGPFTSKDIENKIKEARKPKPKNISQVLIQNIRKGYLQECPDKKDNLKTYMILEDGIKWCESYVSVSKDTRKKSSRTKHEPPRESQLLNISLDELNLENYCDVTKITKFNEQMLVIIYIYSKEKNIEYFSFNDIVAIFKTKFKLPATTRQVRYAFDNGSIMYDKKIEKKIAYHKLMSAGIAKAQKIIEQNKSK